MFGMSVEHLMVLTVVILLFGSKRIPELGGAVGKSIRAFKEGINGLAEPEKPVLPRENGPQPK